jgi:ABC-type oligopeptide transport system, ATPase component
MMLKQTDAMPGEAGDPGGDRKPLLEARDLRVWFPRSRGFLRGRIGFAPWTASASASSPVETLAVVGESGCGKTTLGRALSLLQRPTGGSVEFADADLTRLRGRKLRAATPASADDLPGSLLPASIPVSASVRSSESR